MKEKTAELKEKIENDYKDMMAVINSTSLPLFVEDTIEDMHILIENLIAENKELKENNKKLIDTGIELATTIDALKTDIKQEYDKGYKDGLMKGLQPQIEKNWIDTNARIIKVKSQFVPISLIEKKKEELKNVLDIIKTGKDDFSKGQASVLERIIKMFDNELLDERNNTDER